MGWFRTFAGGERHGIDINIDSVEYVRYERVENDQGDHRTDAVLHMADGQTFRIDPAVWEAARGPLVTLPERTD